MKYLIRTAREVFCCDGVVGVFFLDHKLHQCIRHPVGYIYMMF